MYTQLGVLTKGTTIIEVNISELSLVTSGGSVLRRMLRS
jgi:ribosomal protein S8E